MKKNYLLFLLIILSTNTYSQISFEKGYFINNSNQKIDCLIKNIDWKNNPIQFEYKLSDNGETKTGTIQSVKEFGIGNYSKYVRSNVKIDRSSKNTNYLNYSKNPIFKEEVLYLKLLVEGKANLYLYEDKNLKRFFFNYDNSAIEQLIFKKYKTTNNKIGTNDSYKQQLWSNLKCKDISIKIINNIDYKENELLDFFVKYNQCSNSESLIIKQKQKQDLFNLTLRPGVKSTSLSINNRNANLSDVNFENKLGLRLGLEAEFIMPFNKNKWALIIEPTYQYYKSEKTIMVNPFDLVIPQEIIYKIDYKSIEFPVGIRHYFFLKNNSKIFVNGSFVLDFNVGNSSLSITNTSLIEGPNVIEIKTRNNLAFGFGYKHNDKYSVELRYFTNRDFRYWESDYNSFSIIFGFTLF
ncbi:PorT family protein [Sabulilitoribacter multivorans]|uniref:PorT family protein n=1 Tax=Flaviramulus multivorans TaxID=1304750 RepID=A0ABS9IH69_9FLAO|nr:PorT family protein [Flaviramulus multivorans]MCF7559965.1 PorT family protein [Flaviramulus multivorans]